MKEYTFNQVRKALENKGFQPERSFSSDTDYTTIFEKSNGSNSYQCAIVEEWIADGTCTIDGLNPSKWGKQQF